MPRWAKDATKESCCEDGSAMDEDGHKQPSNCLSWLGFYLPS